MSPIKNSPISRRSRVAVLFALVLGACVGDSDVMTIAVVNNLQSLDPIVASMESELAAADEFDLEFIHLDKTSDFEDGLADLLTSAPDLIVSLSTPVSLAVGSAAGEAGVPQVFGMVTDPLGSGLVQTNEVPGRNRTGVGLRQIQQAVELTVKATGASEISVLHAPQDSASVSGLALAEAAAASLGIEITTMVADSDDELEDVLSTGPAPGSDVFLLIGSPFAARNLDLISDYVNTWDIPSVSALTVDFLPAGFTLAIAADSNDIGHLMAERILAILSGADAGGIPVDVAQNMTLIDLDQVARHAVDLNERVLVEFDHILGGT